MKGWYAFLLRERAFQRSASANLATRLVAQRLQHERAATRRFSNALNALTRLSTGTTPTFNGSCTGLSPSYPELIHRCAAVISLPKRSCGGNVSLTDARHEPPGNGSQTTKQSARPRQARVAAATAAQGLADPGYSGTTKPDLPSESDHSFGSDAARRR